MTSTDTSARGGKGRRGSDVDQATTATGVDAPATALRAQPPRPRSGPPSPTPAPSSGIFRWLSPLFALAAVVLLPVGAVTADLSALDGWGLAKVLGPAAWASLLCAVAACVAELWSPRPRIPMLATATGVLILCSVGMPSVVE
ncbi:MAG: hypothetical protein JWR58_557, partial [Pseudonocardia sp.]|nr:hypothetical protein [Pseudonocardia sp.]